MVYKLSAGVPGNPYQLWQQRISLNDENITMLNTGLSDGHYVSRLLANMNRFNQVNL